MSPTFHALRHYPAYRMFWFGMLVSNVGTWMQRVAQDWLVLVTLGGGPAALGITTGLQFLPFLLLAPFGGALADRLPKHRLLIFTNGFMGLVALTLGLLVVMDMAQVWQVYVLAFLLGAGGALDNPARKTFVAELVEPDDVPNAVGLNSASFHTARLVGPAVAGLLIAALGPGPVFLLNALTFVVPIAVLMMIGRDGPGSPEPDRVDRSLRAGLRYVFGRPDVVMVLVIMFFVGTFGMNFQMTMALMATEVFGQGPEEFGFLGSILAVGSLVGSLLAARRRTPRRQLIVGAAVVFGLMEMLAAMSPTYWLFAVSLFPLGLTALTVITTANAYVQTFVDAEMRGRVTALYLMVFMGGTAAGAPIIGWLAEVLGPRWSMIGGGLLTAAGAVLVAVAFARRDGITLRARLWPRAGLTVGSMS